MITKPMLPPKAGYVEVEVDGERVYKNATTGVLLRDEVVVPPSAEESSSDDTKVWDELDAAYQEGVDSI